ncbi:transcriptional regulator [Streptantibioticus cattleyicolor NRRL 8057 = DSM 46488]|uniref:Transcriptional regulator n=1 Tax=Streptantibioticus cattleyicolor (strain ATCC 35852 / DSM 46488 / JCM 4925 / NBRC 14057 / NRRL 8057) TaxID=1003195 RepID=F8JW37_STREN|nr:transcriptional regulator [Streptantibioticus cattleyicolor NRRL 8057 = DSM 46488]MYS57929.1 TetR family transcriptional regulator [Streptomyces sp. SID5468]CCB73568.1 conserved protein of unknown function [Streptantibioticus cattleyicolor NRRL 8057 = DSM 46488]
MPKLVDHEERRRQIAEAVWRIAARSGLESVTLRQVAAEAGFSMRLVQYYFTAKQQMLLFALRHLHEVSGERARRRLLGDARTPTPREILRAVLEEMLPLDEERRTALLVHLAYFVRSVEDPELAEVFLGEPGELEEFVAGVIRDAQRAGDAPGRLDAGREADILVSGVVGLGMDVVQGRRTMEDVMATLDYHIERIIPAASTTG